MRELNYIDETIERDENPALRIGSVGRSALSTVYLMDCIEGMRQFPDKIFDLAVVDPPYGIGASEMQMGKGKNKKWEKGKQWDNETPNSEYWNELFRVSKNQIVWGGNYFDLPKTGGWIYWNKMRGKEVSFSDGELAWTNFLTTIKQVDCRYDGFIGADEIRIHPTQKPINLYEKLLKKFACDGDLILDTHLGSQSSRIAADKAGLNFVGFEIDREYYDNGNKRFKNFVSQTVLF